MSKAGPRSTSGNDRPKKRWSLAALGRRSLLITILVHVFFVVIAVYLVVEHFQKKHIDFHAAGPPNPHNEVEHKVELAKRNNVESAPPDLKRITTTEVSAITLPDIPEPPPTDDATPTDISGVDGVMGSGMGSGMGGGGGSGEGEGGGMTAFGASSGIGFVGTLYDMKQTPDRQPTPIAAAGEELTNFQAVGGWENSPQTQNELDVLRTFTKTWNRDRLDHYYKAPITLEAQQIFIPRLLAEEAPKAFHVQDTVQPRRWIILYKARIIPPKTGDFRFVGFADDFMIVRIGGRNVLDASWKGEIIVPDANVDEDVGPAPMYSGQPLRCGRWVQMESGVPLDMQVMIGEGPGGDSSFFLMIQEKDDTTGKGAITTTKGDYPIFQLKDVPVPPWTNPNDVPPAVTKQKMVFGVAAAEPEAEPDAN